MPNFVGNFTVSSDLPQKLQPLKEIAYNVWWSWNIEVVELFRRIDSDLWEETYHNPIVLLGKVSQKRLEEVANDEAYISSLYRVYQHYQAYMDSKSTWFLKEQNSKKKEKQCFAYFSAEFGLTECLQTYSGGLGILAGDHLKSASDLGLPLIGVGLLYKEGYTQQYLSTDGWQQERYDINDFYNLPMSLVKDESNNPVILDLDFPHRKVYYQIWKIQVGRNPLYLLDTKIPQNSKDDQDITRALYGGNKETRIQQEILIGIGGTKTLKKLGYQPLICHLNEGHSAFLALEKIRMLMHEHGLTFDEAKLVGFYTNVFTTHTPVPAGIDVFPNDLVEKYFGNFYRNELKISNHDFYALGTIEQDKAPSDFNMAHLAMNTSGYVNGVSRLHCVVSRKMWSYGFKDAPFEEIPIDYITNGVHTRSHLSRDMEELYRRYLGEKFIENPVDKNVWEKVNNIPDEELWRTHERRRERLVAFARKRLIKQAQEKGSSPQELLWASEALNPAALTIGFARRFATYKRATLLFSDAERIANIVNNSERPVQFIIAGKAHPQDVEGKKFIQALYEFTKDEKFRGKVVFIENYDMNVARYMTEGCDIWLNNPRRPLEASGTSGMKVIANGGLNLSILDGWWDEAYDPKLGLGWAIGNGEEYDNLEYQDEVESSALYTALENEILPLFYTRGKDRIPRGWVSSMKSSIANLTYFFNTHRMVQEYYNKFYKEGADKYKMLESNNWELARELTAWENKVVNEWDNVKFVNIKNQENTNEIKVSSKFQITAEVILGKLTPEDVDVQVYYGPVDKQHIANSNSVAIMNVEEKKKNSEGKYTYKANIECPETGRYGYTLRILPKNEMLISPFHLGVVTWA